jgi:hypothetical protein
MLDYLPIRNSGGFSISTALIHTGVKNEMPDDSAAAAEAFFSSRLGAQVDAVAIIVKRGIV